MSATDQEFTPHPTVDFKDQSMMLMALEELGIATMQNLYLQKNEPGHEDAPKIAAQAEEFLNDLAGLLSTKGDGERVLENDWTGPALVAHARAALKDEVEGFNGEDRHDVLLVLKRYLADIETLTEMDAAEKMMGRELKPAVYMNLMSAWSGVLCGKKDALEYDTAFMIFRSRHR